MAKLSITDAACIASVSRVTLHRYIKAGRLSLISDSSIDTTELVRVGFVLHLATLPAATSVTPALQNVTASPVTPPVAAETHAREQLLELLQQQGDEYRATLQRQTEEYRERERAYQAQITRLQQQVDHEQHHYDCLLEAPRHTPVSPPGPGALEQ
jgi:hypothetical protein